MSRINTMARFAEPDEQKPMSECDFCNKELFMGDLVRAVDNDIYCSTECVADAMTYITSIGE